MKAEDYSGIREAIKKDVKVDVKEDILDMLEGKLRCRMCKSTMIKRYGLFNKNQNKLVIRPGMATTVYTKCSMCETEGLDVCIITQQMIDNLGNFDEDKETSADYDEIKVWQRTYYLRNI